MEWPKEISKFFSRQRLASISLGFRVIKISSLGVFNKKRGFYLGVSDFEELVGVIWRCLCLCEGLVGEVNHTTECVTDLERNNVS